MSKEDIAEHLKTSMTLYLNNDPKVDTSQVKFKVIDVSYYEAPKGYICEFKVNMKQKMMTRMVDTVGVMTANVSKDFKDVARRY